jgi:hypothetical protein
MTAMLALSIYLLACMNEVTLSHDEAKALVATAETHLEKGQYGEAARVANKAAYALSRRVEIGEGEAFGREQVPRSKDVAALARARTLLVAATVRSNAKVNPQAQFTSTPDDQRDAYQHAFALIARVRKTQPKSALARQVEAELQLRSENLRADGKQTLLELARSDTLSAPEAWAALASVLDADGDKATADAYRKICARRAVSPIQCAPMPLGIPST